MPLDELMDLAAAPTPTPTPTPTPAPLNPAAPRPAPQPRVARTSSYLTSVRDLGRQLTSTTQRWLRHGDNGLIAATTAIAVLLLVVVGVV
jgi:hypothetical protein